MRSLTIAVVLTMFAANVRAADRPSTNTAASGAWFAPPEASPIAFGTLRLSPLAATEVSKGAWMLTVTGTYFNVWRSSWHASTVHEELGLENERLSTDELLLLERRGPTDHIFFMDLEGWRTDLTAAGRVGPVTASVTVPWIVVGSPHWDHLGEGTHRVLGLGGDRGSFPRGDMILYLRTPSNRVEKREELRGGSFGNVVVTASVPIEVRGGPPIRHRLVAGVQIPTAPRDTIAGDAGLEVALAWMGTMRAGRGEVIASAGYAHAEKSARLFGFRRADTAHLLAGWRHPLFARTAANATVRIDTSPLRGSFDGIPARPSFLLGLGITRMLSPSSSVTFGFGEDLPQHGLGADWTFYLQFSTLGVRSSVCSFYYNDK